MGNNASKTPAPLVDRVKGSRTNKAGSAASKKSAQGIKLNASIIAGLTKKAKEYNEKHPKNKVSVTTLKAVMRRGMGAYSSSHRPTITGGAPNTRQAWAYARVNAFLRKKGGQGAKPTYVQDNDLLKDGGFIAPNGKVSNLTPEQYKLVRTPEFKAWFGDWENDPKNASKIVDENGEPMIVYHGTTKGFNIFTKNNIGTNDYGFFGEGFYFGSISIAKTYSQTSDWDEINGTLNPNGRVLSCFLNVRNPLIDSSKNIIQSKETSKDFTQNVIKNFDGVIAIPYQRFSPNTEYIVFEPNQIKLADGTNKTFDNNNPDIRYADGGQLGQEITCVNCGWHWNTNDSDPSDKYVCHKCGYDNRTYYDSEPIGKMEKGGLVYKKIYSKGGGGYTTVINGMEYSINKQYTKGTWVAQSSDGEYYDEANTLADIKYYLEKLKKDLDNSYADGGLIDTTFYHGTGEKKKVIDAIKNNQFNFSKSGGYTSGMYITPFEELAKKYADLTDGKDKGVVKIKFKRKPKIKKYNDPMEEYEAEKKFSSYSIKESLKLYYKNLLEEGYDVIQSSEDVLRILPEKLEIIYVQDDDLMAHGGLTKSLSVADVHKKYPELPKSFINAQLYLGMKAEMEHTKNPDVAKKIALDHLNESPFYYQYLTKMEKELKGLDVKEHYNEQKNYAKGGEINPDNKGVKDYFAHGSGNVGGVLVGKRHSEGGIKAVNKSTNQPLEMEGGEVVITRNAVSDNEKREFEGEMLTNRQILSRINESGGGVSFADGGDIPESIHTSGKEYAYGGKMVKDHDIVSSCGCKHTMAEGGKLATEEFNEMYGHTFKNGGQIYGEGGMVRIINKEVPTYYGFQELFNGLKVPNLRKEYEGFLKENYKINFTQLPQKIRTGLLLGSQKLIDKYINK